MDFGDILDEWEKETSKPYGKKRLADDRRREVASGDRSREGAARDNKTKVREAGVSERRVNPMEMWLRRYGVEDKDSAAEASPEAETPAMRRKRLRAMKPDAIIDLHGLAREDAWLRLESFFADACRRGLEKVLIIHGKGTHSAEDPVLGPMVKLFLERNRHAGESGHSGRESGGTGSTWVILK